MIIDTSADPVDALLLAQDEVVSRQQLLQLGLSPGRIRGLSRHWQHPFAGVYVAVRAGRPLTFRQRARAGLLAAGDGSRLRGRSAGYPQGLVDEEPDVVEVLDPWTDRPRGRHPRIAFVRERPRVRLASAVFRGLPCTQPEDTVLDLCGEGGERQTLTRLARACQRRLTTAELLLGRMAGRRRVRHRRLLKEILLDVAAGVHSHLAKRWVDDVERPHGLPPWSGSMSSRRPGTRRTVCTAPPAPCWSWTGRRSIATR
ncbi:hypothetical protein [Arsenicicoccus sp. oral taxon 190]|uniref:hypothetical protein n=1 Tax=Arsenicicoccus sp. oral taxon 190 TaxID=1658671 RepID=UPI00067A36E6|nr:hypothetical protein [Arsenicicoccus sp. oral taxon 190]AKT52126.1 hypothetical protein ADJ73_14105 [Arsenicicoccus sp. oral taxon 190]